MKSFHPFVFIELSCKLQIIGIIFIWTGTSEFCPINRSPPGAFKLYLPAPSFEVARKLSQYISVDQSSWGLQWYASSPRENAR